MTIINIITFIIVVFVYKIMSNAITTNYFTTFLQNVDVTNLLLVFISSTINITFSFTNNHSPYQ